MYKMNWEQFTVAEGKFLLTAATRTVLTPAHSPIQWVRRPFTVGVKRPGREADHSPLSSAEVMNAWDATSTSPYVFMEWRLIMCTDNFTYCRYKNK
jgi:hypothetical protein